MKAESSDLKKSPDPRERGPWRCLRAAHQLAPSVLLAHGHAARGESPLLAESRRAGAAICHHIAPSRRASAPAALGAAYY